MSPGNGGIPHFVSFVPAALLLHLAVAVLAVSFCRRNVVEQQSSTVLTMDLVAPSARQAKEPRPQGRRQVTPIDKTGSGPAAGSPRPGRPLPRPEREAAPLPRLPSPALLTPAGSASEAPEKVAIGHLPQTGGREGSRSVASAGMGRSDGVGPGGPPGQGASSGRKGTATSDSHGAYLSLLKRLIEEHKKYPLASRRTRQEGSCMRRFTLGKGGRLMEVEALSSCGHPFLDEAATRAITSVGTFPPPPEGTAGGESAFTVTITFTLTSP